jgi:hypothetical protein
MIRYDTIRYDEIYCKEKGQSEIKQKGPIGLVRKKERKRTNHQKEEREKKRPEPSMDCWHVTRKKVAVPRARVWIWLGTRMKVRARVREFGLGLGLRLGLGL